jgi:flavorubredoxin
LTKNGMLKYVLDKYNEWSEPINYEKKIPVFFASAYNNTKIIAQTIADTVKKLKPNVDVQIYDINEHNINELSSIINQCSAFCIGGPTLNHNVVPPIWNLLSTIDLGLPHKRKALVFGDYGWSGEGTTLMVNYLKGIKVDVFSQTINICFTPTKQDLDFVIDVTKKFISQL